MSENTSPFLLPRLPNVQSHKFEAPTKKINDGGDLQFFFMSTGYGDLTKWLLQLNRATFPSQNSEGIAQQCTLNSPPPFSSSIQSVISLLGNLSAHVEQAPPDTGPRRFGNVAFRKWFQLAEESANALLISLLDSLVPQLFGGESDEKNATLIAELQAYLLGSFGSSQRLDYGTGHELSFLAFLGCLWKMGGFQVGEERAIVLGIVQAYLELVRKLIMTYTLEPAGSHGVWGLDDHSFLPYIFGSAQLGPAISHSDYSTPIPTEGSLPSAPSPSSVTSQAVVADYKDSNMYFSAIQFIYDVKRGPFWEHSPVLYDVSGIKDGWGKINKGMLKMYAAEVLGKFPVVQHFPFGSLFEWKRHPAAAPAPASVHAQQQPGAVPGREVPTSSSAASARSAGAAAAVVQVQSSTGMPTTRAPWASGPAPAQRAAGASKMTGAAPWANTPRQGRADTVPTAAPWSRKT